MDVCLCAGIRACVVLPGISSKTALLEPIIVACVTVFVVTEEDQLCSLYCPCLFTCHWAVGCSQLLAAENQTSANILVCVFGDIVSSVLGKFLGVE